MTIDTLVAALALFLPEKTLEHFKELLTKEIPLVFPGTKLESAFASFLKASDPDAADTLGEYRHFKPSGDSCGVATSGQWATTSTPSVSMET